MSRARCLACLVAIAAPAAAAAQPSEQAASSSHAALSPSTEPPDEAPDAAEPGEPAPVVFGEEIDLYDPSGRALAPLYRALRRAEAGEGQARILFYGASHVAADYFTNVVRTRLQERFGDAGHGFILPARPWRYYRHLGGVSVESSRRWEARRITASSREVEPLGLAGVAVESSSPTDWGRIDTGSQTASRFEIFYWRQPRGGAFDVYLDGRRVRRISTAAEEPGPDYAVVTAEDARHVLEVRVRGNGPVRLFGVSIEREVPGVIVDTLGINGARASSHLLWDEALHTEHLRRRAPDLVVLAYGTNESGDDDHPIEDYEATLRSVVARVRGTVPDAACMLIGPSDRPLRQPDGAFVERPRTQQIIEVQRRVSRDFGCAFFDLVAFGGGPLHMVQWAAAEPPFAQTDYVHYTARGYLRLGEVLHAAIMRGWEAAERFDVPSAVASGPPR
ncbi:MAG TPA: GDSL-type esterase/lipase family protein [Sandaracinaceae bacterium]